MASVPVVASDWNGYRDTVVEVEQAASYIQTSGRSSASTGLQTMPSIKSALESAAKLVWILLQLVRPPVSPSLQKWRSDGLPG